jgi:hypothetical protein
MMQPGLGLPLARLRPRDQLFYVSRNRTLLATARDGFIPRHVVRQPSPWSMTTSPPERLIDAFSALLPGH